VVLSPATKPTTISEEMFYKALAKKDPALPELLKAFLAMIEPIGVIPELKASLNLKADLGGAPKATNLGYIDKAERRFREALAKER
jgi:hypothetical protein